MVSFSNLVGGKNSFLEQYLNIVGVRHACPYLNIYNLLLPTTIYIYCVRTIYIYIYSYSVRTIYIYIYIYIYTPTKQMHRCDSC